MVRKTPIPTFHPHTYVGFGGVLNTGAQYPEIWTCGVRVVSVADGAVPLPDPQAYCNEIQAPLAAWFGYQPSGAGQQGFPATCNLGWIKVNNILPNGKYADNDTHQYSYATPVVGKVAAGGAAFNPDVIGLAVSWMTQNRRGKAARGRMYLPNYHVPALHPGGMEAQAGHTLYWRDTGVALLHVINNPAGAHPANPIIASTTGEWAPINGVRVGSTFDIQRRRKSAVPETYVSVAWAPT